MKYFGIALAIALLASPVYAGKKKVVIPGGSKIFIEAMDNGLDELIRASIFEKGVDVTLVLKPEGADYVLRGFASEETQRKWHEGFLTARKAHASGAVTLIRVSDESIAWAQEASDKNRWWGAAASEGHRKVAKRIADELKRIVK